MEIKHINHPHCHTIHTPFVMEDGENTVLFCAAGRRGADMDIWVLSNTAAPKMIIKASDVGASTMCGPWAVRGEKSLTLYVALSYFDTPGVKIAKFTAPSVYGPYTLVDKNAAQLTAHDTANGPCVVGETLYYIEDERDLIAYNLDTGMRVMEMLPAAHYIIHARFKPNIFVVGEDHLAMFLTEIDDTGGYRNAVFSKMGAGRWKRVAELPSHGPYQFSYKPFLHKGHLVRVGKNTIHYKRQLPEFEETVLEVHKVKLSEIWSGFSDYEGEYELPEMMT